ncbi:MAG TPA: hypothetical protein VLH08_05285 [Acidobacteriota bacterium]|nr:hypothetical protein [Acidobacteriota bacterium]
MEKLPRNDLAATLTVFAKRGTPSDLETMIDKISADPKALQRMGPILSSLADNNQLAPSNANPLEQMLR